MVIKINFKNKQWAGEVIAKEVGALLTYGYTSALGSPDMLDEAVASFLSALPAAQRQSLVAVAQGHLRAGMKRALLSVADQLKASP